MITEYMIRKKFIHETIRKGMDDIQVKWRGAVGAFGVRTGELRAFADHPSPTTQISSQRHSVHYYIPLHMRFLDIRYSGRGRKGIRGQEKRNLYNKIVWPVLYQQMLPELKHGFSGEVRRTIREQLEQAMNR